MNVHDYIKFAAVSALIALTVFTVRREHKHPLLVTKVSEIVVMKAAAEEVEEVAAPANCKDEYLSQLRLRPCPPQKVIAVAHRKVIVDRPAAKVEHVEHALAPWALPWSCSKVKWAAATFSKATLESMRVAGGVAPLTGAQKQQAKECIEGKRQ